MRSMIAVMVLLTASFTRAAVPDGSLEPAAGWSVEGIVPIPDGVSPSAMIVGPRDLLFLGGRDGRIWRLDAGMTTLVVDRLGPIAAFEWADDKLFVLHGSTLSCFGRADAEKTLERVDLVMGLGEPSGPGDPIGLGAVAIRRGMDGFLYIAVGDRGVVGAEGKGGESVRMQGGGVLRVRLDGSALEIVSTGDARPGALFLTGTDDVFTFSTAGDPRWGVRLLQHVPAGRHGYPYHFVTAEFRTLPPTSKLDSGHVGGGVALDQQSALSSEWISCDPDGGLVHWNKLKKVGGGFQLASRTPILARGGADEFAPIALTSRNHTVWILDRGGDRIIRLAKNDVVSEPTLANESLRSQTAALDHPSISVRLETQDRLARTPEALSILMERLGAPEPLEGRLHALWALNAMGGEAAWGAVQERLADPIPAVRLQAIRSVGIRRDATARQRLEGLLTDRDAAVRREAAVALGRLGDQRSVPALIQTLGDSDRFTDWSIRQALRKSGCDDRPSLVAAFKDPSRRESALLLADECWSVPILEALVEALGETPEPLVRSRMIVCLAGQFRCFPEWTGEWFGPDPLSGPLPSKSRAWDPQGMAAVVRGVGLGLKDSDPLVRYQAALGLQSVGPPAGPILREALAVETDVDALTAIVEALGAVDDAASTRAILPLVVDPNRPESVRSAALDSLNRLRGRDVVRARLTVLYEEGAPETLVARALPPLARDGFLPANDLGGFLLHPSPLVRAAAVMSLNPSKPLPIEVKNEVLARFDDEDSEVRRAVFLAAGPLKLREAVPRLLEYARSDEYRTAAVSALCSLTDPRALSIYVDVLDDSDPSLKRRALAALIAIRDGVEEDLRRMAGEKSRTPEESLALRRVLSQFEPIQRWTVLGPVEAMPDDWLAPDGVFDVRRSFNPEEGGLRWTPTVSDREGVLDLTALRRPGMVDLAGACTEIEAPIEREAILILEGDAPADVFWNGRRLQPAACSGGTAGDYYLVKLVKGVNRLAVLSRPGSATWRFAASISSPDGERL